MPAPCISSLQTMHVRSISARSAFEAVGKRVFMLTITRLYRMKSAIRLRKLPNVL
jgi:hypothetical protein